MIVTQYVGINGYRLLMSTTINQQKDYVQISKSGMVMWRDGAGFGKLNSPCSVLFVRRQQEAAIPVWSSAHPSGSPTVSVET